MTLRTAILLALSLGLCVPRASAQLQFTTAPTGLIGSYAMSNGNDSSGNGRTGTLTNTTVAPGKYAEGQRFNGASSRMTIPSVNVATAFTVEAWIFLNRNSARAVGRAPRAGESTWQAIVYRGSDTVFLAEVGGFVSAGFTTTAGTVVQIVTPGPLTATVFHHVAATYDGASIAIYVDGAQAARIAATGTIATSTQPWEVGGSAIDLGYLDGIIDDVRIYSRALNASEVSSDMATPVDTVREPVVSWDLEVWPKGADPALGGPMTSLANFLRTGAACNLAPLPPPVGTVTNPSKARLADPDVPMRECELIIQTFITSVPVGLGYFATVKARGATTVSERSGASNPFDRVAVAVPPLPAGPPSVRP